MCGHCGGFYQATRPESRFCSTTCRVRAFREKQRAAEEQAIPRPAEAVAAPVALDVPAETAVVTAADPVDDGLVFCDRCQRRVPPEVRQVHLHGVRSGLIQQMTEEDHAEWDQRADEEREWARWFW